MPVIVATIVPLPGQIDAAEEVFKSIIPQVHTEDGCELYALHRSADKLVFVEKWRDGDAIAVHRTGEAMRSLGGKLTGLLAAAPEILTLDAVPAGDPAKGAV